MMTGTIPSATLPLALLEDNNLRQKLIRVSLVLVICFPFGVYLPLLSFVTLTIGCLGALLCFPRLPWPPISLTVSTLILLGYLAAGVAGGDDLRRSLGTSNHMLQWIFATYVFYAAFRNGVFDAGRLRLFVPYLIAGHILAAACLALNIGQQEWEANPLFYEHNILSVFTIFVLCRSSVGEQHRLYSILLFLYVATLTVLTDRISVQGLNVMILGICFFRVRPEFLAVFAIFVLALPVYTAFNISTTGLANLIDIDFNTYIRMEFINSAYSMLQDRVFIGVGFDTLFRPLSYPYLQSHPLLNDPDYLASVSNHHSLFDTAFRFGIILAPIFLWPILRQLYVPSYDRAAQVGILIQAFGLSFNAYFEQQGQISTVCFITAMLLFKNAELRRPQRG